MGCIETGVEHDCEFANVAKRIARKEHKCGECGEVISKGRPYFRSSVLCDGGWFHHKVCAPCHGIGDVFCAVEAGELGQMYEDEFGFSPYEVPEWDGEEE